MSKKVIIGSLIALLITLLGYQLYRSQLDSAHMTAHSETQSPPTAIPPAQTALPTEEELMLMHQDMQQPVNNTRVMTNLEKAEHARKQKEQVAKQMRYGEQQKKSFLKKEEPPKEK